MDDQIEQLASVALNGMLTKVPEIFRHQPVFCGVCSRRLRSPRRIRGLMMAIRFEPRPGYSGFFPVAICSQCKGKETFQARVELNLDRDLLRHALPLFVNGQWEFFADATSEEAKIFENNPEKRFLIRRARYAGEHTGYVVVFRSDLEGQLLRRSVEPGVLSLESSEADIGKYLRSRFGITLDENHDRPVDTPGEET